VLALERIKKAIKLASGDTPPDDGLKPGNMVSDKFRDSSFC
jgi:hypothetical protein